MTNFPIRGFKYIYRLSKKVFLMLTLYPIFWLDHFRTNGRPTVPIFIVGAPRTGSTIFYQALTNCYDVKYIDNVASSWYMSLPFGMWLSNIKYGMRPHNNYFAEFGNTLNFGGHAPSECGDFWYRWLPNECHFVDSGEVSESSTVEIRRELDLIMSKYPQPLLFKNLNMGQRLRLIHEIYPDAKIIFIRRDPRFVIRSMLSVRKKLGLSVDEWWSVRPRNFKQLVGLSEVEMCAAQVYYIDKQIKEDMKKFDSKNLVTVHYNELSETKIASIANFLGFDRKNNVVMPAFRKDEANSLNTQEKTSIGLATQRYAFEKELFV